VLTVWKGGGVKGDEVGKGNEKSREVENLTPEEAETGKYSYREQVLRNGNRCKIGKLS
jgi:hypothetical protein